LFLSEAQRWLLTIASVMGENFLVEVVAHVAGEDARELTQILSRTLQSEHHLVEAEGVERSGNQRLTIYRFRHNLMQVYLYEQLDKVQRVYPFCAIMGETTSPSKFRIELKGGEQEKTDVRVIQAKSRSASESRTSALHCGVQTTDGRRS
jgi:hypothetical protein